MEYLIYNKCGKILRKVSCPKEMALNQLSKDEFLIEGDINDEEYKIVNKVLVKYSQKELDDKLFSKRFFPPNITKNLNNQELNLIINKYFLGRVDVKEWRIKNYSALRRIFYPSIEELIDAELKIRSKIEAGEDQRKNYDDKCWEIKKRFPK